MLPISFTTAMTGIIFWILTLIRLSKKLHDVPSASIGISIVAIPVFLILMCVFWYVFLGIMYNQEEPPTKSQLPGERESGKRLGDEP